MKDSNPLQSATKMQSFLIYFLILNKQFLSSIHLIGPFQDILKRCEMEFHFTFKHGNIHLTHL